MLIILPLCWDIFGERNGNPLQYSCLESPIDGRAWWAAVYGIAQSRTRLKWLSSSSRGIWYLKMFKGMVLKFIFQLSFGCVWWSWRCAIKISCVRNFHGSIIDWHFELPFLWIWDQAIPRLLQGNNWAWQGISDSPFLPETGFL